MPAARYHGGVMIDNNGQTDIRVSRHRRVTYTGLHGANRMASNSLLRMRGLTTPIRRGPTSCKLPAERRGKPPSLPAWDEPGG